jgi:hypothetical protein
MYKVEIKEDINMALGNYNNNGKSDKKKDYSPVTYSGVRFFNSDSAVDPSSMSFSFWKGLLKIAIIPVKKVEGSVPEYDKDNELAIYLTPLKAALMHRYMKTIDINKVTNFGVATNKGIIYITNGKEEFNVKEDGKIFCVLKLIDENGAVTSAIAYEFFTNYFGIKDYTGGTNFTKDFSFSNNLEYEMFIELFKNYVSSSNYAYAATVVECSKFDMSRLNTKIGTIQEKLGIENKYKSNPGNKSFFNNNGNVSNSIPEPSSDKKESYDNYSELINSMIGDE